MKFSAKKFSKPNVYKNTQTEEHSIIQSSTSEKDDDQTNWHEESPYNFRGLGVCSKCCNGMLLSKLTHCRAGIMMYVTLIYTCLVLSLECSDKLS